MSMKYLKTFALSKSRVQSRKVSLTNFFRVYNKMVFLKEWVIKI